jgi:CheY-like chemotaxis protein
LHLIASVAVGGMKSRRHLILIVDDSPDTCVALTRLLEHRGYSAACAHSGMEALAFMRLHRPQMVVLDQHMPGQSGLDTFKMMRQDDQLRAIPVVFFSADDLSDLSSRALAAGAMRWVTKTGEGWKEILEAAEATCHHPRA